MINVQKVKFTGKLLFRTSYVRFLVVLQLFEFVLPEKKKCLKKLSRLSFYEKTID